MTWYAYHLSPLDHGWEQLPSVGDVAGDIASSEAKQIVKYGHTHMLEEPSSENFLADWAAAKEAASAQGWEGDFRKPPVVFWLPNDTGFTHAFAFKQDNNGSTFIVSPYRLPWMDRLAVSGP
jgi:hypothetical protein